jgi:hydrogenase small subunit
MKIGAFLAAGLGLGPTCAEAFAEGLEKIVTKQAKVLWLQGMSCTGCSVSFLNADAPGPLEVLTDILSLVYHSTLSAAQGADAMGIIDGLRETKDYFLVVEGAIPVDLPKACVIGGRPLATLLPPVLKNARAIVAAGTCASFGGIPAAEGSPVSALSVKDFMERQGLDFRNRLVNCPGCPVHPHCLLGTVAYVISKGYPRVVPGALTPTMFYQHSVHDECPRFHYWEKEIFARQFGEEGCLFKLGCLGPLSHTTCPRRQWNGGVNWCIRASAPCIACTGEQFGKKRDFPFYRKGEAYHLVNYHESDRKEKTV